ncbi:MAG: YmdB family metallophosphoesterase [Spirochaetaceae bacterium]|nr:YmdB family metallophosphoesterase [Spirochaetaceae bacterium]
MEFRILYIAELVGKMGVFAVKKKLPELKRRFSPDIIIANADGVTGGAGIGKNHAIYLRKLGITVLTGGDNIYLKKDTVESLQIIAHLIRPSNFSSESPGKGWRMVTTPKGKIAVVSLIGQTGFSRIHGDNPFIRFPPLVEHIKKETPCIIVDYHGATTAEKHAFGFFADGTVTAVIGSHGRVQTAEARILPGGTGVIIDAGRTGCRNSVGGFDPESRIRSYITGIPDWGREAVCSPENPAEVQGVFITADKTGVCTGMEGFRIPAEGE